VSRALNDAPHVSETVRRKVKEAAAALDYHPNLAAQSLIARRSYLIGLTYERPSPSYVVELQNGALGRLENERYRLVVLPFNHVASRPEELGKLLLRAGLDGVLLAPPACDQPVLLDMIERQKLPYARITPHSDLDRGLVVAMNEVAAGHTVAAHILSLGHRRVGVILGDPSHAASRGRLEGYRQAFDEAGVAIDDSLVGTGDFTYDVGYRVALELLDRPLRPTAILAQNDDMAVAAIAAARDLGLSVPQQLSVAGFDNSEVSRTAWPQLTTVHQPVREMAWDAANRLIAALDGETDSAAPYRHDHPHELLVRASTAPPPAQG
jgi:LacI family transcriptional regulator